MRLDKFLKVSRLVKRRPVANELCSAGGVVVNGKVAKPSTVIQVGDEIVLYFGNKTLTVTVNEVPQKAVPVQLADSLYTVVSEAYST